MKKKINRCKEGKFKDIYNSIWLDYGAISGDQDSYKCYHKPYQENREMEELHTVEALEAKFIKNCWDNMDKK